MLWFKVGKSSAAPGRSVQDAKSCVEGATGCDSDTEPGDDSTAQKESPKPLRVADLSDDLRSGTTGDERRRARDSNPQPVSRHLISSEAASHSLTLRARCAEMHCKTSCQAILRVADSPVAANLDHGGQVWPHSVEHVGSRNQLNEISIGFELSQLLGQLLHRVDVMHRRQCPPQHGHGV